MINAQEPSSLLDYLDRPGFIVRDRKILHCNSGAEAMLLTPGTDISTTLVCGWAPLEQLKDGNLCTAINLPNETRPVTISRTEDDFLFILELRPDEPTLRALARASQQLRNPLNELLCIANLLAGDAEFTAYDNPSALTKVKLLQQNLHRIYRIIDNMSAGYEFMDGREPDREAVGLSDFFAEIFEKVSVLAEPLGIEISFQASRKEIVVWIDRAMVQRCVLNLLSNALRFTPKGGFIRGKLLSTRDHAVLRITDSGDGISSEFREHLFSGYRRPISMEDPRHGLGVGLLIARSVVTAHGGALYVGSSPKGGTEVSLSLSLNAKPENILNSPGMIIDRDGFWDRTLVELSRELPLSAFDYL